MKTVKFVQILPTMEYPVGENITKNLPTILAMSNLLKDLYPSKSMHLWCRGSSGAIIAAIIATNFKKVVICHVKKSGESSHTDALPKSMRNAVHIIVDDFIAYGSTVNEIYTAFKKHTRNKEIDCLCVTGKFNIDVIHFIPKIIVAKSLHNHDDMNVVTKSCEFDMIDSGHVLEIRKLEN